MELFSLLAKLTLDASEFNRELESAESAAESFSPPDEQKLELNNSDYTDSLDEAEAQSESFSSSVGSIFSELKSVIAGLGIAAVVGGIVSTLKEGVELAKNHGDAIDKQSQKMNISAKAYQEWAYALNLSGASIDDLNRGLRTWQQAIGDEDATNKLAEAFKALGMDSEKAIKQLESGEKLDSLLDQVMSGLADYTGSDRGAIAEALFGKGSTGLNALFNSTSADIREMKQEANDLGLIMTDEEVKNAAAYMDATTRLEGALNGIKEAFAAGIIPLLTEAANTVAAIVAFFNPRTQGQSLSDIMLGKDQKFAEEIADIEGTAAAAETLADKLLSMGDTSKMTADQYAIWKGTAEELIKLVPSLSEVIDTESGKINANSEEIKENIKQWENLAKQKALQTLKEEKYQAIVEKNQELIDKSIKANKKAADAEKERTKAYQAFSDEMKARGYGELDFSGDVDQQISDLFSKLAEMGDAGDVDAAALGAKFTKLGEATTEAGKAKAEAEKLAEELKKGEQEYQDWLKAAEAMYGETASQAQAATTDANALAEAIANIPNEKVVKFRITEERAFAHAIGSAYVPYDNYPALLHRGEKVLTRTEARKSDQASTDLSGLEDRLASAIKAGMNGVTVNSYLNGRNVTDEVNRESLRQVKARRFAR